MYRGATRDLAQRYFNADSASTRLAQHCNSAGSKYRFVLYATTIMTEQYVYTYHPANTKRRTNDVLMLGRSRRRWTNMKTTLVQRLVFAGNMLHSVLQFHVDFNVRGDDGEEGLKY